MVRITVEADTPRIAVAEGIDGPESFTIHDKLPRGAGVAHLKVAYRKGRYQVLAVTVEGHRGAPVTAAMLRLVKVAEMLPDGVRQALGDQLRLWRRPEGRPRPTPDTIEAVAKVYKLAFLVGDNPKQAVAKVFGVPVATAGRWISTAREVKHLGRGRERKAGI